MALKICSFASGSGGNCIYVASETTSILVDVGISVKRIKECLCAAKAKGELNVLITHTHSDHIAHLKRLASVMSPKIYVHRSVFRQIDALLGGYDKLFPFDGDFYVGDITVSPFRLSHDVPCLGFGLINQGSKVSILTDTGVVTDDDLERIAGSKAVFIESNHDVDMLKSNGRYSYVLKRRILSPRGHLSNGDCAQAVVKCVENGASDIVLCHLSRENNTPELALGVTKAAIDAAGLKAHLSVAYQDKMSEMIEVCNE